ncbi:MAG: hypothetical protein K6E96_00370 [Bacteroidales bacterium]|nr:hypothetical protein [Bacteroidales bacterium]
MSEIIKLDSKNYKQYTPFDIVAFRDVYEVIDRSKRVFDLMTVEEKHRAPLYELFHFSKKVSFYDTINDRMWKPVYIGKGEGIRIHYSISHEFQKRTNGMPLDELRENWREIVINIVDDFPYFEMRENDRERKEKAFELLKSKIHIGDNYSDIKTKLSTLDIMKKWGSTTYTDYYLPDLRKGKDGLLFAFCSYHYVGGFLGLHPKVTFCRLNFNQDKVLVSIEDY